MEERTMYMTRNACYRWNLQRKGVQKVQRIILHATAVRGIMAEEWFLRWNRPDISKCAHLFVDDTMALRYLPDTMEGWHVGGTGNRGSIGIEMCEDRDWAAAYFEKTRANTMVVVEGLCRVHGLDADAVLSHREAHQRGMGSNHGDPDHWWRRFGYTMTDFRKELRERLEQVRGDGRMAANADPRRTLAALNLRADPGMEGRIRGVIPSGTVLTVKDAGHPWAWTEYRGKEGYVHSDWLEKLPFRRGRVLADVLNIRGGRGTEHPVLGRLEKGKALKLLEFSKGWWSVAVPTTVAFRGVGFVHGHWVALE